MNSQQFTDRVGSMLREQPAGTVASFGDFAIASLVGKDVVYSFVAGESFFVIGEKFDLRDEWDTYKSQLVEWLTDPQYGDSVKVTGDRMSADARS